MYKIAIIGPKDIISGFKALGVIPFDAEGGERALEILKEMKKDIDEGGDDVQKFATVIIIESIAQEISADEMDKITKGALPAIVALPGLEGSHGAGVAKLKRLAERAIGSDVLG
jgi:vacuolar-type H+-ATPase subunit F/Vma7